MKTCNFCDNDFNKDGIAFSVDGDNLCNNCVGNPTPKMKKMAVILAKKLADTKCAASCMDNEAERQLIAMCAIQEFTKILNYAMAKFEKATHKEHVEFMKDRSDFDGNELDMDMDCDTDELNTVWEQGQRKGIEQTIRLINEMTK